ncbi:lantibiotic immunity ABC transporter MutG family permease subunit [Aneurinibacillus thermoaerophilus]|uniref:lantibiotic immunity ABC transporter MutG family permease subunit n=1 Tax=Aneurinibacillus thermoaerophilus TaxID=143495 RepID=UPI002E1A7FDF|nr:lantibiotic immunity ABC transporter MutG family permease subunit [Aneurinibacillus thermoaerophilus]MED0736596.1 lantibiotic immunity ABC transporter MutG family permease subunit [Aneurinibacillus thermoaerophilus]MED0763048.1 lantibiotic immunity ABC transporter MutG family permease subunit [Aneurinibacillus thermoaerophilus]
MHLLKILSSEWIKTKRTTIRLIVFVTPIIYPIFMLWYFSRYNDPSSWQIKIYGGFFEVLTVSLPIIISLFTGLISYQEEKSGNFINLLAGPVSRAKFYFGKLFLLILSAIVDIFLATFLMLLGMRYILHVDNIHYDLFLQGVLLSVIGSLILFSMHMLISFALGMGASIAIGGGGFLISAIIGATVVGDNIWQFIPWAWTVRLSQVPMLLMPEAKHAFGMQLSNLYFQELLKGIVPAIICFILVTIIGLIWFNRWEGDKSYE